MNDIAIKTKGAKGSPCATRTWLAQRVSAIALVPLSFWFVILIIEIFQAKDMDQFSSIFTSPFPTVVLAIFIVTAIYHGCIGMIEIIEDYVHCSFAKMGLILSIKFLSFSSAIAAICAIIVLHLSTFVFN